VEEGFHFGLLAEDVKGIEMISGIVPVLNAEVLVLPIRQAVQSWSQVWHVPKRISMSF
jgi:hypothetical protein